MKNLFRKELRLCVNPVSWFFLACSAMLMIPSYPYGVLFFYTTLSVFYICLSGRENRDILYSCLLPASRSSIVTARIFTALMLEGLQLLLCVPFAVWNQRLGMTNSAGMDANTAFFGTSLILLGLFNLVFFPLYYSAPEKVGRAFAWSSAAVGFFLLLSGTCDFIVPFFRSVLDTPDPENLSPKLAWLAFGILVFTACTLTAWHRSRAVFEKIDL